MFSRTLTALLLVSSFPTLAVAQFDGVWDTSYGEMVVHQSGVHVSGTYGGDNGRIDATLRGNVLEGIWTEEQSSTPCANAAADGRLHWGRIRLVREADGSFLGSWSYCDAALSAENQWTGRRTSASAPAQGLDPPATTQAPAQESGFYRFDRREVVEPELGPRCHIDAADANDRGMRFDYTCMDVDDKPVATAASFNFVIDYPPVLRPGSKVVGNGTLVARARGSSAACSIGPGYLVPSLSTNLPEQPSDSSSGEVEIREPWCDQDPCELVVTCNISNSYGLHVNWIYRWVRPEPR